MGVRGKSGKNKKSWGRKLRGQETKARRQREKKEKNREREVERR